VSQASSEFTGAAGEQDNLTFKGEWIAGIFAQQRSKIFRRLEASMTGIEPCVAE